MPSVRVVILERPATLLRRRPGWLTAPSIPLDFEAAIIAYLNGKTSLAPLGGRIYTGNVPGFPARPHLIISMNRGLPEMNLGYTFPEACSYQYTVVGDTHRDAEDLGWAVISSFVTRAQNPYVLFQNGSEDARLIGPHNRYWQAGPSSNAQSLCYFTVDIIHRIGRGFTPA